MTLAAPIGIDLDLPHLARALDGNAVAEVLGRALPPGSRWRVCGCTVDRVKVRPGRNATLAYDLNLQDPRTGESAVQRVSARLCNGDGAGRHARALASTPAVPSKAGPSVHLDTELDLLTWWWPNDAKLSAPKILSHPALMHHCVLPDVVAALSDGQGVLQSHRVEVVQHVPEHRVTARVDLCWTVADQAVRQSVYVKAGEASRGASAHAALHALGHGAAARAGRLRTPAAVLWQPDYGLRWLQALPGRALLDLPREHAAALAGELGRQLAALHASPLMPDRPGTDVASLQGRLNDVVQMLGAALPHTWPALARVAQSLSDALPAWGHGLAATLHGDLHPRNLLVDGDRVAFIDLDDVCNGPPVLELGAWQSEGVYRALLEGADPLRDAPQWHALLDAYARAGGVRPTPAALARATAWHLLTQRAWRCVVNLKPGRPAVVPALLEWATRLLEAPTAHALEAA